MNYPIKTFVISLLHSSRQSLHCECIHKAEMQKNGHLDSGSDDKDDDGYLPWPHSLIYHCLASVWWVTVSYISAG